MLADNGFRYVSISPSGISSNIILQLESLACNTIAIADSLFSLLDDYEFAIESGLSDPDITAMIDFLRLSKDVLLIEAEQLPTQITGRLTNMNTGSPGMTQLIDDASKPFFNCLLSTQSKN